ncbi:hypothetical protein KI387_036306, partial [Taxus chinensis]
MGMGMEMEEIEEFVEECIAYRVGLPVSVGVLAERLAVAEEAHKEAAEQVAHLQDKLRLAREEAGLSAAALRKHVAEAEHWRNEATRLDKECALYLHDRELFMEAADEADEKANRANERAIQANNNLQLALTQIHRSTVTKEKMDEELDLLRQRVTELEAANRSLQNDQPILVEKCSADCPVNRRIDQLEQENRALWTRLEVATTRRKDQLSGLQTSKPGVEEGSWADKLLANSKVSSMVAKGLCRVTEQEKKEAIAIIRSNIEAFVKEELCGRLEDSEKAAQLLVAEVQSLRKEKNHIKSNLEKAEVEVQLLDDENRELRLLLRGKLQGSDGHAVSPLLTK